VHPQYFLGPPAPLLASVDAHPPILALVPCEAMIGHVLALPFTPPTSSNPTDLPALDDQRSCRRPILANVSKFAGCLGAARCLWGRVMQGCRSAPGGVWLGWERYVRRRRRLLGRLPVIAAR
jgi:hypothetical protein